MAEVERGIRSLKFEWGSVSRNVEKPGQIRHFPAMDSEMTGGSQFGGNGVQYELASQASLKFEGGSVIRMGSA